MHTDRAFITRHIMTHAVDMHKSTSWNLQQLVGIFGIIVFKYRWYTCYIMYSYMYVRNLHKAAASEGTCPSSLMWWALCVTKFDGSVILIELSWRKAFGSISTSWPAEMVKQVTSCGWDLAGIHPSGTPLAVSNDKLHC